MKDKLEETDADDELEQDAGAEEDYVLDYVTGSKIRSRPEEVEARQPLVRRLVEEYGYSKDQIQTVPEFQIKKGSQRIGPVDIAVFGDSRKDPDNLYIIVENKRKDVKDGRDQLKSYMNPSVAQFGVWFNGKEILYLQKVVSATGKIDYKEIPNIPRKNERLEDIGKYRRKDLTPALNPKILFKTVYYHLYSNSNLPRAERLAAEMIRLLFCKLYDEYNTQQNDIIRFRWGIGESFKVVGDRIRDLFDDVKKEYAQLFGGDEKIVLDDKSIAYVVGEIQRYCFHETDAEAIGDAFEVFIGPSLRGEKGQFFTPRNVVRMCVEILDPDVGEKVIDPACGSGGFLIVALDHVWRKLKEERGRLKWSEQIFLRKSREIADRNFDGVDKEFDLTRVAKAYMAIVGDGKGGIFCEDSLASPSEWKPLMRERTELGEFDIVMTNPPFGSKIPITDKAILEQYDLGHRWVWDEERKLWGLTPVCLSKQVPQVLFIERCLQLLKPGGRLAIVLPDGIIGNDREGYIREFIKQRAVILGVVDCPAETFLPDTNTKTSVLFLRKAKGREDTNYPIFMAIATKCGHNRRGKKTYKVVDGKEVPDDDFPKIAEDYRKFRVKHGVEF